MGVLDTILARAAETGGSVVLPEAEDPRVLRAARRLADGRILRPVILGSLRSVRAAAKRAGVSLAGLRVEDPHAGPTRAACLAAVGEALAGRGVDPETMLADPLYYAAAMVRADLVSGSLAGATHSTAETLRAALRVIGPAEKSQIVSSLFVMALREPSPAGDEALAFADCGLVPAPDSRELAEIARQTAASYGMLCGREPRVAFLSFSTQGSAKHDSVERVRRARDLLLETRPQFPVDGELQADAALVPAVGSVKAPGSAVAGRANVLIFPDLNAGNIGYKLVERLAGARAIGPILQGLDRPANDLSRGCSEADVVVAAAVTVLQAGGRTPAL